MSAPTATPEAIRAEVLNAAARLVEAFGNHDAVRYFACFSTDATFLFHTHPELIASRAEYEQIWKSWEADGFHVDSCTSLEQNVLVTGPHHAVFTHRVRTRLAGESAELAERETMVFRRDPDGDWLVVHEHLSPDPVASIAIDQEQ